MGKDVVVMDYLTEEMIRAGSTVVNRLTRSNVPLELALWYRESDDSQYKLILVLPDVKEKGPRKAYEKVNGILQGIGQELKVSSLDITVWDSRDPKAAAFKSKRFNNGEPGIHIRSERVGDMYVEDAYLYHLEEWKSES